MKHLSGVPLYGVLMIVTHKHYTRVERPTRDKHSCLFLFYSHKEVCKIGPGKFLNHNVGQVIKVSRRNALAYFGAASVIEDEKVVKGRDQGSML